MLYTSTRDKNVHVSSAQAIAQGISAEGGLFVPEDIPKLSLDQIAMLAKLDYIERAKAVLSLYLTDFTPEELDQCVRGAYAPGKFSSPKVAPIAHLSDNIHMLELWRGPTCAFKDMALQLLPHLLTVAASKTAEGKTIVILVATSGDTGKAALEGFKDVPNTKILVFYPDEGVSPMQKLQMTTQEGENVGVCAIRGNFDDAQTGVKAIFTDPAIAARLAEKNMMFSSANSINWGRLVPQIVYYISAYCDLLNEGSIALGDKINVVVPTGNFGNILAAYYARRMGLPIKKLVCASNANNVLTDFLQTGRYDRNRIFFTTMSPSMDILISSNLERLLFDLCERDDGQVRTWMDSLKTSGCYDVGKPILSKLKTLFDAGCCNDGRTKTTIRETYHHAHYLCDTHTAVAVDVCKQYLLRTGDNTPMLIVSTANPFKFSASVLSAVKNGQAESADEFGMVQELSELTGEKVPVQLANLAQKKQRFKQVCERENMKDVVYEMLGIHE